MVKLGTFIEKQIRSNIINFIKSIGLKTDRSLFFPFFALIVFYGSQFFIKTKPVYFLSYFMLSAILYFIKRDMIQVLLELLTVSIFFDVGLGGRIFLLQPEYLKLGSGWWFTPSTVITIFLVSLLPFYRKNNYLNLKIINADVILILFLLWNCLSFLTSVNLNSFLGLIQLFETILIYFLFRILLTKKNLNEAVFIIISMIFFQATVSLYQFFNKNPLGMISEPVVQTYPQTLTYIEGANIYRSTGTFGHANMLAAFFIALSPFIFLFNYSSYFILLLYLIIFFAIILTYSRISWIFFAIQFLLIKSWKKKLYLNEKKYSNSNKILIPIFLIFIGFLILPFFLIRIVTSVKSFTEFGSLGMRVKLTSEGLNLITKNPVWGVGLNRSLETYSQAPITNIFKQFEPGIFYKIHNTFLEIASESGIPGLILFLVFLALVFLKKTTKFSNKYIWLSSYIGFAGTLITAYVNPFFHTPIFKILLFLAALILV